MPTTTLDTRFTNSLAPSLLTSRERVTLAWVCGALFPRLEPGSLDDPSLFGADAISVGVPAAMEEALSVVPREQLREFRLLLRALDNPVAMMALCGKAHAFRALPSVERERALAAMATSTLPVARRGFQALKRLAAFLFYSLLDERRTNPTWSGIGYTPSDNPPACERALALTSITRPAQLDGDVCVVGSGAGGGVVAAELARSGLRVIVLEQGPGDQPPDFDQREVVGMQRLYLNRGTTSTRDLGIALLAGSCLGGGTAVNYQTSLRPPAHVLEGWTRESGLAFLAGGDFSRSVEAVWERVGASTAESVVNANNATLRRGCEALGWPTHLVARDARGCDPAQCGYCLFGCRRGGKQSTAVSFLADAQRAGSVTIVPHCRAVRVTHERGRVTGVQAVARDADSTMGAEFKVDLRANTVVVAAGSLETPALLARSGVTHSALGRHLHLHPTTCVVGLYPSPVRLWDGPPQTVMCDAHASVDGGYGFLLEVSPGHPGLIALALPWFGARAHREHMQRVARVSATIVLVRDRSSGRVRVRRDGGFVVDYRAGTAELGQLRRGMAAAIRAHVAAGAEEVVTLHSRAHALRTAGATTRSVDEFCDRVIAAPIDRNWSTLFSAHQMGSCRMGADPKTSVCDETGRVRGVAGLYVADASLFPGSSGVNPMITVMSLAHWVSTGIAARSR